MSRTPFTTRRGLLRAAGGGLVLASAGAQASDARSPNRLAGQPFPHLKDPMPEPPGGRVGYAVVGLGQFAVNQILPSFAESRRSKLVALVSGDRAKAERIGKQYGVPTGALYEYRDLEKLRDDPAVQVVYVITPNSLHAELTLRAFKAGKHVLCEKPLATTAADCERMIAAGKQAGRKLMTAYRAQYEPYNLEAIRLARSGELGAIVSIVADHGRTVDPNNPADRWRLQKDLAGGGPLPDVGIYSLNACRYLTGEEPSEVAAMLVQPKHDPKFREVEQAVHWTMRFPSGVLANCTTSYDYQPTKRYRVLCKKGWLELDPATDYDRHRMLVERKLERKDTSGAVQLESVIEERPIAEKNQFAAMLDHFSECIQQSREPKTPGEEGLRDVRIIEKIYEAARTGRTIKL